MINECGLIEKSYADTPLFRVDKTPPEIVLSHGFSPSSDFTAVNKMLPEHHRGLIAGETLKGVLRYRRFIPNAYVYEIKGPFVKGVSLKYNFLHNKQGLAEFLEFDVSELANKLDFADCVNGAIYLSEVHLYLSTIMPADVRLVETGEILRITPLNTGHWRDFL
ncbi:hypothetical protein [Yersinia enterocolitica]|uniref:hypothetical protein n=1 Tax=Yersinia enterocolitica TaxID=630 RepID=UPI0009761EAD|nr:hypothetical protein [Yersinia enterocolitica]ELI7923507.1 hypothetical protein [Yersinia enterocolitica]